jgi:polygalacturonase
MKRLTILLMIAALCVIGMAKGKKQAQWPDGTIMDAWFSDTTKVDVKTLGKQYVITDYGVKAGSSEIQTAAIQQVIDKTASAGGGVIVIPAGTFYSGSLFFKQGTHLWIEKDGVLKGSNRIRDFKILETRIEGQTCPYFTALVNADSLDGFVIGGEGTIDGN